MKTLAAALSTEGFELDVERSMIRLGTEWFPALVARDDVLPWSVLTAVKSKKVKTRFLPAFTPVQYALNQKTQRIQGYMMPLDPGEKQVHFLLSSVPLTTDGATVSTVMVKT